MLLYFCLLNVGNNVSAWRSRTVFKSSMYMTDLCTFVIKSPLLGWGRVWNTTAQEPAEAELCALYLSLQPLCWVEFLASEWNTGAWISMSVPISELPPFCSVCIPAGGGKGRSWMSANPIQCFVKWPRSCGWLCAGLWLRLRHFHLLNGCESCCL